MNRYCQTCGEPAKEDAKICSNCKSDVDVATARVRGVTKRSNRRAHSEEPEIVSGVPFRARKIPLSRKLKRLIFAALAFAIILLIPLILWQGATAISEGAVSLIGNLTQPLSIFTLLAVGLTYLASYRMRVGTVLAISSYLYGSLIWLFGLFVTVELWGILGILIGLLLLGVGVIPLGILASIFSAEWGILWDFTVLIALFLISRSASIRALRG